MHEEGLLEEVGPIYDTNDGIGKSLAFPCLHQDPKDIVALSMIHYCFPFSHTITNIDKPSPPPKYGIEEDPLIRCIRSSQSYPQDCEQIIIVPFQCDHHIEQSICCVSPCPGSTSPSHHDLGAITKREVNNDHDREFLSFVIHSSILCLQERLQTSKLASFPSSKIPFYTIWISYFPTPHLQHPLYDCFYVGFWVYYTSNHIGKYSHIDLMMCWLHCPYDYT